RIVRGRARVGEIDLARFDERRERALEEEHALALARLHRRDELRLLAFADERGDSGGRTKELDGDDAAAASRRAAPRQQPLRDDGAERVRELAPRLLLLLAGIRVDDARD